MKEEEEGVKVAFGGSEQFRRSRVFHQGVAARAYCQPSLTFDASGQGLPTVRVESSRPDERLRSAFRFRELTLKFLTSDFCPKIATFSQF